MYLRRRGSIIVDSLEKEFERAHDLQLKILSGDKLTDEEKSFSVRSLLHVCSSSLKTDDGLKRIQSWFERKRAAE